VNLSLRTNLRISRPSTSSSCTVWSAPATNGTRPFVRKNLTKQILKSIFPGAGHRDATEVFMRLGPRKRPCANCLPLAHSIRKTAFFSQRREYRIRICSSSDTSAANICHAFKALHYVFYPGIHRTFLIGRAAVHVLEARVKAFRYSRTARGGIVWSLSVV